MGKEEQNADTIGIDNAVNAVKGDKSGKMQKYKEGDIIFNENDLHPYMYKILKGKVALYVNYGQEHENVLGILKDEQFFGEISMLTGRPQVYTAVVLSDSLIMKVDEEQLDQFLSDNRGNTMNILRSMAKLIVAQNLDISLLMKDIKAIVKELPEDNRLDPKIAMRLKQYQLKYVEKSYTPELSFFEAKT